MIKKIFGAIKNPVRVLMFCSRKGWLWWLSDKTYLKIVYRARIGEKLNLKDPETFNEKLQWIKLYDRRPEYTRYVDKYEVRGYIEEVLGGQYIIPLIGLWDKVDEIDFDALPEAFVLKCTHDSGSVIVCKDKNDFDVKAAKRKLSYCLKNNGYNYGREWPYKNVKPRIIAEKYMEDESGEELKDYKVLCFSGEPKLVQLHRGRFNNHTQDFYDTDWNKWDVSQGMKSSATVAEKPAFLEEMLNLSKKLAEGIPHVRVDWYYVEGQLYFGELTFFDGSGFDGFEPDKYDKIIGNWIKLPQKCQ